MSRTRRLAALRFSFTVARSALAFSPRTLAIARSRDSVSLTTLLKSSTSCCLASVTLVPSGMFVLLWNEAQSAWTGLDDQNSGRHHHHQHQGETAEADVVESGEEARPR